MNKLILILVLAVVALSAITSATPDCTGLMGSGDIPCGERLCCYSNEEECTTGSNGLGLCKVIKPPV